MEVNYMMLLQWLSVVSDKLLTGYLSTKVLKLLTAVLLLPEQEAVAGWIANIPVDLRWHRLKSPESSPLKQWLITGVTCILVQGRSFLINFAVVYCMDSFCFSLFLWQQNASLIQRQSCTKLAIALTELLNLVGVIFCLVDLLKKKS